ncbi:MAG: TatD family hydrolase [Candidatus Jorgensenbacteria bacterium]
MKFLDAHTHTQFSIFDADRDAVIRRALEAGVAMVNVGTQADTSARAVELAHRYKGVWATVGLHPIHTAKTYHDVEELGDTPEARGFTSHGEVFDEDFYGELAGDPEVVAIGECGLDYFHVTDDALKEKQREAFAAQIKLAHEVGKPLMIHCRNAFPELISILNAQYKILNTPPGIIHFFSGTLEEAAALLGMGFYFTFGGVITYPPKKGGTDYEAIIKTVPVDRILSETDAPYVAPVPHRGGRNEPAYVVEVVKKLAELKDMSVDEMAARILANTARILAVKSP